MLGDHTKAVKEAKRMPGIKRHHQESENPSKSEYIFGHAWGCVSLLVGNHVKRFSLPLYLQIQDGLRAMSGWEISGQENGKQEKESMNTKIIAQAEVAASQLKGDSLIALDRAFLSVAVLKRLLQANLRLVGKSLFIVTKAKSNCVAYGEPPKKIPGTRGAPRKKGETFKLKDFFTNSTEIFCEEELFLYGVKRLVQYKVIDLLWGQKLYQKLRFVLVRYDGRCEILVTTNLELGAKEVIETYGCRFKIECAFRSMKQSLGTFAYRFWSRSMPKLNRYYKKDAPCPLSSVMDEKDRLRIQRTVRAIEMYALCSCIAMGLLQLLSLELSAAEDFKEVRYLRSKSNTYASEETMMAYMRHQIYSCLSKNAPLAVIQIILRKQKWKESDIDLENAA